MNNRERSNLIMSTGLVLFSFLVATCSSILVESQTWSSAGVTVAALIALVTVANAQHGIQYMNFGGIAFFGVVALVVTGLFGLFFLTGTWLGIYLLTTLTCYVISSAFYGKF